jgi:predicted PurR-regulated permease PerM
MKRRAAFYVVLVLLAILALVMLRSVLIPALLAVVLGYVLLPVYDWMGRYIRPGSARAAIMVLLVLFAIAFPALFLVSQVADELPRALRSTDVAGTVEKANRWVDLRIGRHIPFSEDLVQYVKSAGEAAMHSAPGVLGVVGNTALGLFVVLYTLYYVLQDGRHIWENFMLVLPLEERVKPILVRDLQQTLTGVLYGQVLTALVLGLLFWPGYWLFHVSHVLFWVLLSAILAVIPIVGPNIIWVPLAISRAIAGDWAGAAGLVIYCGGMAFVIDNIVKARLISGRTEVHPLGVLLGVMGGLEFFGLIGFLFGPLLLSLLLSMLRFHRDVAIFKVDVVESGVA